MSQSSKNNNVKPATTTTTATAPINSNQTVSRDNIALPELSLNDIKTFDNGIKSTNMLEAKIIAGVEKEFTFKILEIQMHDQLTAEPITAYTIGQYEIFSDAHIPWGTYNVNTLYQVRRGSPTFWIADEGKTIKAGSYICVPSGIRHCVYNHSNTVHAIVDMIFPGKIVPPNMKK